MTEPAAQPKPTVDQNVIRSNEYQIVQKIDGEQLRVMRFAPKTKILIEKLRFMSDSSFGHPYGVFEVVGDKSIPVAIDQLKEELAEQEQKPEEKEEEEQVDRVVIAPSALKLEPEQKRQKLDQDSVLEMKKLGVTGNELVTELVKGSASFNTRTTYSQSKYITRKAKKHSDRVLILKPTIRLIAKAYYLKDPERIALLRNDQLGLILQMAGIHHGKNVIVFEQTLGLITSAVVERLGGKGACVHIHRGATAQSIPCVHSMNFDSETMEAFLPVRLKCILAGEQLAYDLNRKWVEREEKEDEKIEEVEKMEDVEEDKGDDVQMIRRNERLDKEKRGLDIIENGQGHALIIGCRMIDPVAVLEKIYPKLAPAATVVVYSQHQNVVVAAYKWLSKNYAINLNISNQMCRIMQVLPDRTHPLMSQFVAGGHVLSGIKTLPPDS